MFNSNNKNIVYVGGFGGIGFETCKSFLSKGIANLVILDVNLNEQYLQQLQHDFPHVNIMYLKLDITDKLNIVNCFEKIIEKIKYIDILVNGSGVVGEKNPELIINVNLTGLINTCLIAIPLMDKSLKGRGGTLVNISSTLGLEPCPPFAVYSASKHGIIGFTRSLADENYYQRTGIIVIGICPSITDTPIIDDNPDKTTFPYSKDLIEKFMPTKKQTAKECADNIVKAIEVNKNGSIWILELGKLKEVQFPTLWEPES